MIRFNKQETAVLVLTLIIAAALFVVMLVNVFPFGVDDSFIFYRYAENIANGQGFRFNPGEMPGEGFTSWLWTLVLSVVHFLGLSTVTASKIMGILFLLLSGRMVCLTVRKLMGETPAGALTALTLAAGVWLNFRMVAHSVSGMETSMYLFALTLLIYLTTAALMAPAGDLQWWWKLGAAALLLFLVRPEGIVAGSVSLAVFALSRFKELFNWRTWTYLFFSLILPLTLFLSMKVLVFGYIMPHSYYHKIIVDTGEYSAALDHLLRFVKSYGWLMAAALISIAAAFIRKQVRRQDIKISVYLYFLILFVAMTALYLLFYPAMNYLHRFYIPYLPLLFLMLVPAFQMMDSKLSTLASGKFKAWKIPARLLVVVLLVIGLNTQLTPTRRVIRSWTKMTNPAVFRARLGILMKDLPSDVVIANTEMGVIPYYSGLTCIDMAGLTDPYIAHHGLSMDYLIERKADLIIFSKDVSKMTPKQWESYSIAYKDVFLSQTFKTRFKRIGSYYAWPGRSARYYLYADTASPRYDAIDQWRQRFGKDIQP